MKFVLSACAFGGGFAIASVVLGLFGLSPVVQLLGGAWLGYLVAQPVWSWYADREAFKRVRGLFGDAAADAEVAADDVPQAVPAGGLEAARSIAARSEPPDGLATRLRPVQCPACGVHYERRPETTFLGFQRFTCGECRLALRGPLKWGFGAYYWLSIVGVAAVVLAAGRGWHPGMLRGHEVAALIFALGTFAALVDAVTLLLPRRRRTFLR